MYYVYYKMQKNTNKSEFKKLKNSFCFNNFYIINYNCDKNLLHHQQIYTYFVALLFNSDKTITNTNFY